MADKYRRVEKPHTEQSSDPNEVRLTAIGKRRNYISYAIGKFQGEQPTRRLVLKGMGAAVVKVVTVAEIVKRRIAGLHQITTLSSTKIVDEYEPLEEGECGQRVNAMPLQPYCTFHATNEQHRCIAQASKR